MFVSCAAFIFILLTKRSLSRSITVLANLNVFLYIFTSDSSVV